MKGTRIICPSVCLSVCLSLSYFLSSLDPVFFLNLFLLLFAFFIQTYILSLSFSLFYFLSSFDPVFFNLVFFFLIPPLSLTLSLILFQSLCIYSHKPFFFSFFLSGCSIQFTSLSYMLHLSQSNYWNTIFSLGKKITHIHIPT